ncbi:hypothetical protein B566_EDAN002283 [Ephemera danica]|nr:hypothetical protein B566_EDAN002283 [Ephemera danica]
MSLKLLSRNNIPKLMNVLKSKLPYSSAIYNWLRVHSAWDGKVAGIQVKVLCPEGDFNSGAAVAFCQGLMKEDQVYMTGFADENNVHQLSNALEKTTLIPWSRLAYILEVVDPLAEPLKNILGSKISKFSERRCNFFYVSAQDAIKAFERINIPDGFRFDSLKDEHLEHVCQSWEPFTENFRPVFQTLIRHNESMGLFIKDKLIMSALENQNGAMGIGYTAPEFRNMGLATVGLKYLAHHMAIKGIYNWLRVHNNWEKKVVGVKVQVFCIGGDYRSGVVVALCHGLILQNQIHMTLFANAENSDDLAKALNDTELVPWSQVNRITYVTEPLNEFLKAILTKKNLNFDVVERDLYYMSADNAIKHFNSVEYVCPPELRLGPLDERHVDAILNNYKHWGEAFRPVIAAIVQCNRNIGVFQGEQLIAHTMENWNGAIGVVFTDAAYRNRGLACLAASHLAQAMAKDGSHLHLVIHPENIQSIALFSRKLYFGEPICKESCFYKIQ